jgi:hypothetical protein
MMGSVEPILAAVEDLAGVTVESDRAQGSAGVRMGARIVARIDHRTSRVLVDAPARSITTFQREFLSSRATTEGSSSTPPTLEALRRLLRRFAAGSTWRDSSGSCEMAHRDSP